MSSSSPVLTLLFSLWIHAYQKLLLPANNINVPKRCLPSSPCFKNLDHSFIDLKTRRYKPTKHIKTSFDQEEITLLYSTCSTNGSTQVSKSAGATRTSCSPSHYRAYEISEISSRPCASESRLYQKITQTRRTSCLSRKPFCLGSSTTVLSLVDQATATKPSRHSRRFIFTLLRRYSTIIHLCGILTTSSWS